LLAFVAAMFAATPAFAQTGVAGRPVDTCVLRDAPGLTPQGLFASPARFDCRTPQTDFGRGDYWVLSSPVSVEGPAEVRSGSLWQHDMTLHALYADGTILTRATDGKGASRHMQLGAVVERGFPARDAPLVRLLWHVGHSANMRGIVIGPRIATPEESARANLFMDSVYAGFGGLCIALMFYNLALYGALRYRFQLAYCAMLAGLMVYAFSSSGFLAWVWPDILNNDRLRLNYISLGLSAVAAMLFARSFFEPRVFAGWLARASNLICALMFVTAAMLVGLPDSAIPEFDKAFSLVFVAQIAIVVPILWRGWRTRSNYLWLFALAWGAPILLACSRVANSLHLIGWNFWLDNSTIVTMAMEALLSSLAIAYRIRILSRERDEAREQEIAARMLADTDPLTGLLNRRAFLARAIGREGEQTLLILDIDHFKSVNDTIGHDGGDEVLRLLARVLRQSAPAEGLIARFGGEEFAMVVPAALAPQPEAILVRLRATRMPFDLTVTASIGTCSGVLAREIDWKALYRRADRALFEAKAAGRDRARAAIPVAA